MRGKDLLKYILLRLQGITPAHAGKSTSQQMLESELKDHPRTCGEKPNELSRLYLGKGSPPHMRGKVLLFCLRPRNLRITPAHAGKSVKTNISCVDFRDHPRTCGEKQLLEKQLQQMKRITPAHAGKSIS